MIVARWLGIISLFTAGPDGTLNGDFTGPHLSGAETLFPCDFDGDVRLAVAVSSHNIGRSFPQECGQIILLHGNGKGGIESTLDAEQLIPPSSHMAHPVLIGVGDASGDKRLDLVAEDGSGADSTCPITGENSIRVLRNNGQGGFLPGPATPQNSFSIHEAFGDLDGDGAADVAQLSLDQKSVDDQTFVPTFVTIKRNDGSGRFRDAGTITLPGTPSKITVAGVRGSGQLATRAILARTTEGIWRVSLSPQGTLDAALAYQPSGTVWDLAVADFDGDGEPDLALLVGDLHAAHHLDLVHGRGDGTFDPGNVLVLPGDFGSLMAAGDFDGDCAPDLVTAGDQLHVFLNRSFR